MSNIFEVKQVIIEITEEDITKYQIYEDFLFSYVVEDILKENSKDYTEILKIKRIRKYVYKVTYF
jgi:hypothetical protein